MSPENDLFASIGTPPDADELVMEAKTKAEFAEKAAQEKAEIAERQLITANQNIHSELMLVDQRMTVLTPQQHNVFSLEPILEGWFPQQKAQAPALVNQRASLPITIESAANYGVVSDAVVRQFVDSAHTKATGEARLEVAKVLDQATGVADGIAQDQDIQAAKIEEKAQKVLKHIQNADKLARTFERLFTKVLNRVQGYQSRLQGVGIDLAKKSVMLDSVSASLRARKQLVKDNLYDVCISGMALEKILEREQRILQVMEAERDTVPIEERGQLAERIREQQSLVQLSTKRLVDLKAFAVKLVGLYSVLGTVNNSVNIIRSDVEFTRTNLIATLGLQLGLVVDVVSTLRVAKATQDVRAAEARASEAVGVATSALDKASQDALLNVGSTMRSLEVTIKAALNGIRNTQENMEKVAAMQQETEGRLSDIFLELGSAN
jgi:hypothetical protein